ncbi:MAG: DMT family transporter [Gemmatimonadales bacterium]
MKTPPTDRPSDPATVHPAGRLTSADAGMVLVCLIWGVNFSVTKLAIGQIPALPFTAIRFVLASALLWAILRVTEGPANRPAPEVRRLVVLGVVGNTCYQIAFVLGLARTSATNSSLILATVPTVVAVVAGLLGFERITARMWWGIALGTIGVILVIATSGVEFSGGTLAGDLLTVLAVLCWAGYTVGLRTLPEGFSALRVTTVTTIAGTPGLLLVALPGLARLEWGAVPGTAWVAVAYATVLSLVVAYLLWNRSVQAVGGTRTAIYMCVTPLVAIAAAWVMLGEHAQPLQAVGTILIVAGVLLTRW